MAIWQFKTHLVPEQRIRERYGHVPVAIPVDDGDRIRWWDRIQPLRGFEAEITEMLPETQSWDSSSRMWGDDKNDTDFVWVMYTDDNRTFVEGMEFRFHAADISASYVAQACRFAGRHGCLFVDNRSRRVMAPNIASLMDGIRKSTARKFIEDPVATLENLPVTEVPAQFSQLSPKFHRFYAWLAGVIRTRRKTGG